MAKVTKNPGKPAYTREDSVSVKDVHDLKEGDKVTYVSVWNNGAQVDRKVEEPEVPTTYTLELSQDEAQFLQDVFYHIAGDIRNSRRKFRDAIAEALRGADVKPYGSVHRSGAGYRAPDVQGSGLTFKDGPDNPFEDAPVVDPWDAFA